MSQDGISARNSTLRAGVVLSTFPGQTSKITSKRMQNRCNFTRKTVNSATTAARGTKHDILVEIRMVSVSIHNPKNTAIA
jgi:hypothetical protein